MSPEEIDKKIADLMKRTDAASKKKATLGGQLAEKREQLATLIKEIQAAGYDPKTLPAERDKLQKALVADLEKYEKELSDVETALAAYDTPGAAARK